MRVRVGEHRYEAPDADGDLELVAAVEGCDCTDCQRFRRRAAPQAVLDLGPAPRRGGGGLHGGGA